MIDYRELVRDKKVLIIGPSEGVKEDLTYIKDEKFDLICRLNNHYKFKVDEYDTDIIYHNCMPEIYDEEDIKFFKGKDIILITKTNIFKLVGGPRQREKVNYFKKMNDKINFKKIIEIDYKIIKDKSIEKDWNIGNLAIIDFLDKNIKSLSVIGYDFYDSLYNHGLENKLNKRLFNKDNIEKKDYLNKEILKKHNPCSQFKIIKNLYLKDKRFFVYGKLKERFEMDDK